MAHHLGTERAWLSVCGHGGVTEEELMQRGEAWIQKALLWAFRECLLQKVTRKTGMVERVSSTKEEDALSRGNVSTGKVELGQKDRGHRSSD